MTTYKCLLYDVKDGIATLTLNRPERLNALGDTLREDLHDAVMRASEDDQVRVMIVTGAGKGFCSGGDVKAMNERKTQGGERPIGRKSLPAGTGPCWPCAIHPSRSSPRSMARRRGPA